MATSVGLTAGATTFSGSVMSIASTSGSGTGAGTVLTSPSDGEHELGLGFPELDRVTGCRIVGHAEHAVEVDRLQEGQALLGLTYFPNHGEQDIILFPGVADREIQHLEAQGFERLPDLGDPGEGAGHDIGDQAVSSMSHRQDIGIVANTLTDVVLAEADGDNLATETKVLLGSPLPVAIGDEGLQRGERVGIPGVTTEAEEQALFRQISGF